MSDKETERDAARYRWLRAQYWDENKIAVALSPKQSIRIGSSCPFGHLLDEEIDRLMEAENVQSIRH